MNTTIDHSPIYSEPTHPAEYCPQAYTQTPTIDHTTMMILHYFQQVKDALSSSIVAEDDRMYKIYLIGRLYEIDHIQYILQSNKLDTPRDI